MLSVAILDKFLHSVKVCAQLCTSMYLVTRQVGIISAHVRKWDCYGSVGKREL